jgi:hypothetical protein
MKKLIGVLLFGAFSLGAFAQSATKSQDDTPWDYVMMRNGKMIEVQHSRHIRLKRSITLVNGTTIHVNGKIDDSNGKTKWLKNGQYIQMDGKIDYLKEMGKND